MSKIEKEVIHDRRKNGKIERAEIERNEKEVSETLAKEKGKGPQEQITKGFMI